MINRLCLAALTGLLLTSARAQETNPAAVAPASALASLMPRSATNEPTVITSEKLRVDYADNIGTFTGNVLVVDPRITVRADQMVIYFATTTVTNATSRVAKTGTNTVASTGTTTVTQHPGKLPGTNTVGSTTGTATNVTKRPAKLPGTTNDPGRRSLQKILADGGVVITQEKRKATSDHAEYWAEEGKVVLTGTPKVQTPDGSVSGTRITFWYGSERMEVDTNPADTNRTRLVIYPDEVRKQKANPEAPPAVITP